MINITVLLLLTIYCLGIFLAPFPYWRTYFILWRHILFNRNPYIGMGARAKQAYLLIKYAMLSPLWTFLWYVDELCFPGYKRQLVKPLFIIGQPRSGTTLLHRTLAADQDSFFSIRHIEWRYPYITIQKLIDTFNLSHILQRTSYWPNTDAGREASSMHPNSLYDAEEDGIFYEECFLHHFFIFLRFPYPELLSYLNDFPALPERVQTHMLAIHRKVVQKIMYLRGDFQSHYLSKEVTSHNKIHRLLELYPDARFILIVRRSSEFMNSLLRLVRFSTMAKTGVDPIDIPGWEATFIECMRDAGLLLARLCESKIDKSQRIHVSFDKLTNDIVNTIRYIYSQMGKKLGDTYLQHLDTLRSEQKNRERGYTYQQRHFDGFEIFDQFVLSIEKQIDSPWHLHN